jgi:hypothetical protein
MINRTFPPNDVVPPSAYDTQKELTMSWNRRIALFLLPMLCLTLSGCGRRALPPTYPVHGSVTLDQKPVSGGMITFASSETGDLQAIPIENGKYEGQARAGKRRVEIRAYPPRQGPIAPMDPPPANYIPAQYNSATTLSAEVTPQGPNQFNFELKSR